MTTHLELTWTIILVTGMFSAAAIVLGERPLKSLLDYRLYY